MIDVFYTPDSLAMSMVRSLPKGFNPSKVADFTAGEGSLLEAAASLWPGAMIFANDVCPRTVRRLRAREPQWSVSCVDFVSERSRTQSKFGRQAGAFDLILLNPPFSQRGMKPTGWPGMPGITTGQAALFLYIALGYLAPSGYLLAILPDGCLSSTRDRKGWMALAAAYDIEVISNNPRNSFKGVSARTSIVRVKKKAFQKQVKASGQPDVVTTLSTEVVRGAHQMHVLQNSRKGIPLIHTSELRDGAVCDARLRIVAEKTIRGPALLFPRVGRVTPEKVCFLEASREVALSDCVLGIRCATTKEAHELKNKLLNAWPKFAEGFRGTGAPYITVERAARIFADIQQEALSKAQLMDRSEVAITE